MMAQRRASRREFLRLGAAAAVTACGGCAMFGSRKADVVVDPREGVVHLTQAQSAALLASEGSILVQAKGRHDKIIVVHPADHAPYAVSAICTHMGCTVKYDKATGQLACPCHGSRFALDGSVIRGPAKQPLRRYDVTLDNDRVLIKL